MKEFTKFCFISVLAMLPVALSSSPKKMESPAKATCSPLCDCTVCECEPTCLCNTVDQEVAVTDTKPVITPAEKETIDKITTPLVVGSPPDTVSLADKVSPKEPPPGLIVPVAKKADPAPAKPVASGHYEYRQVCGPNGCSMQQVWVPHNAARPATQQYYYSQPVRYGLFGRARCRGCR